jgi:DNA-directed RNA polymerase specialized sigma subunit
MHLSDPELLRALETLLPRERKLIELRSEGKTFTEIGRAFGYSRSQAYRFVLEANRKLRARLKRMARADERRADEGNVTDEL